MLVKYKFHVLCYDDDQTPPEPPTPPAQKDGDGRTFTQEDVNRFLAEEKRKDKERNAKTVAELNELRKNINLTQEQKEALETQVKEIESKYMTQQEIEARNYKREQEKLSATLQETQSKAETWQKRYNDTLVSNAITSASVAADAYSVDQMVTLLGGKAKVLPVMKDGQPTDSFEVKISFNDVNQKGESVTLDLTPQEAMKRMKELPETYGNLFKGSNGGVGGGNNTGVKSQDLREIAKDPAEYRKYRKNRG